MMVSSWSFAGCSQEAEGIVILVPTIATEAPQNESIVETIKHSQDNVLTIATHAEPANYDVHRSLSSSLHRSGPGLVYSRLLRFSYDFENRSLGSAVECDLCSKWEQTGPTTYRFTLRENVRWHNVEPLNGRLITVEDVINSYRRQKTQGWPNEGLLRNLKEIAKIDDFVLEITTHIPDADFVLFLASGHSKVLPLEVESYYEDVVTKGPIGTGPWILLRGVSAYEYLFEANPFYYETGLPKMDILKIRVMPDQMVRFASMAVGGLDFADLTFDQIAILNDRPEKFATTTVPHYGHGIDFVLNTHSDALGSQEVRRAIFEVINPWEYGQLYWPDKTFHGLGFPITHDSWYMSKEELVDYVGSGPSALRQPSSFIGERIVLSVGDYGENYARLAKQISKDLDILGMSVDINMVFPTEYVQMAEGIGSYDMYIGPSVPLISPNQYFFGVLHSGGRYNSAKYNDAGLDLLIELQAQDHDILSRSRIIKEINQRGMHSATRMMLLTDSSHWGWDRQLVNVSINSWAHEYFHYAYFDWSDDN
jgi:peptide/nickel transport system substrate-binding protein